jgi:hypothetical protein
MIEGLLWMVFAHGALLLAAHALLRRIRTEQPAMNAVLFVLLHLLLVSGVVLIAGVAGMLRPRPLGVFGAVLLAVLLALREHRTFRLPPKPEIGRPTAVLATLIGFRMLLHVWFLSPSDVDAVSYHLPKIAEWVQRGAFTREMGSDYCAPFPAGFELIETWWVVFLHHDVLIEMAGVEFAVLAFLAVRLLAEGLGMSPRSAFLSATLYVLTPTFNVQSVACLNDAPVAALVLSLVAFVVTRAHPILLALPLGLVAGLKATGLYTLSGWVVVAFLLRKQPFSRPASVRAVLPLAVIALAVGAFWYLRNFVWYGNPVYPVKSGPLSYFERLYYIQVGPSVGSLWGNLGDLVSDLIYDRRHGYSPLSAGVAGWGIVPFSLGALAVLHEIRGDRKMRQVAGGFLISVVTVLLMVKTDAWFARFILFVPALACIAVVRMAERMRPAAVLLALGAGVQFVGTTLPQHHPAEKILSLMKMSWRTRSSAGLFRIDPTEEPVGVYAPLRSPVYLLYGPDYSRRVEYLRVRAPSELAEEMDRRGLRLVFVNILQRPRYEFEELVRRGTFRQVHDNYYRRL